MLLLCTVAAITWANLGRGYDEFWHTDAGIVAGSLHLSLPLLEWVNEALMAVFVLTIGLEVRREFAVGDLHDRDQAILPLAATVGGVLLPAGLYLLSRAPDDPAHSLAGHPVTVAVHAAAIARLADVQWGGPGGAGGRTIREVRLGTRRQRCQQRCRRVGGCGLACG